ncbi:MAG: peroxidase-related enzyme [Fidelibacterota bacterium]
MEAHGDDLRSEVNDGELVESLKRNWREASISDIDGALCEYAEKLTRDPSSITQNDIDALRAKGVDDRTICDAAQIIAFFNYMNRIADGLGVDLEPEMKF